MNDTDHAEGDGQPEGAIEQRYYVGTLQALDIIAIGFRTAGNVVHALSAGCHMLATELQVAAAHKRKAEEVIRERAEADFHLRQWAAMDNGPMTTPEPER